MGNLQFQQQEPGQAPDLSQGAEGAAKTQATPTSFTEAQLQQIGEIVGQSLEGFSRQQQSQRDKLENRIKQQTEQSLAMIRNIVGDLTPEQEKAIANEARNQVLNDKGNSQEAPAQGQTKENPDGEQQGTDPMVKAVNDQVNSLYTQYGFDLDSTDPEAQGIDQSNAFAFVQSVERALEAKKARLEKEGLPQKPPQTNTHMGGGGSTPGNPIAHINDPDELLVMGLSKKK